VVATRFSPMLASLSSSSFIYILDDMCGVCSAVEYRLDL
jgi:hypothetical protein